MTGRLFHDDAARDDPRDNRQVAEHFEQAVAGREALVREDLGENAVFRRTEERRLNAQYRQDRERAVAAEGVEIKRDRAGDHQRQFQHFHRQNHATLAETIGQHSRRQREEEHLHQKDGLHQGGHGLRPRLLRGPIRVEHGFDRQHDDDLLPGVVVERAEELRHEQAAHRMRGPPGRFDRLTIHRHEGISRPSVYRRRRAHDYLMWIGPKRVPGRRGRRTALAYKRAKLWWKSGFVLL